MHYIYNFLWCLILPFLPLRLLWRSRKNNGYRKHIFERFACFDTPKLKQSIWIHAVSVGEVLAAVPLIKSLLQTYPHLPIVVTTMTPTGRERIHQVFPKEIIQFYVPYDHPFLVKRFLAHIQPRILILMETELWPNIIRLSNARNVPVIIANACLSDRSFPRYQRITSWLKPLFESLTLVMAQSELDARRFVQSGLTAEKVTVAGNLKFDAKIPAGILPQAHNLRVQFNNERYIWVAASTHAGEEEKILEAMKIVLAKLPRTLLILVPRHPERFEQVFNLCHEMGFNPLRYSNIQDYTDQHNVIVGDVMGQLLLFYAASDVAFVGGSLIPWGGHNLLEPAALAKPVISGVHLNAFLAISRMLQANNALVVVEDATQLAAQLLRLFADSKLRIKLGEAACKVVEKNRGAKQKIMDAITRIFHKSSIPRPIQPGVLCATSSPRKREPSQCSLSSPRKRGSRL